MNSKKFSERKGYTKVEEIIQKESLNDSSRKSLWNLLYSNVWGKINDPQASRDVFYAMRIYFFQANGQLNFLLEQIWIKIFERTIDRVPISWDNYLDEIKKYFFNIKWYEVYDFIEFILESASGELNYHLTIDLNELFSKERIPYAIINNLITDITNDSELNGINEALGTPFGTVNTHVSTSLSLLYSNSPDYRNSIKESISAVEAIVKIITKSPNGTLGDLLKILERNFTQCILLLRILCQSFMVTQAMETE
ncbi:hypothetical protein LEP1GSC018_1504 [Leptospira kirschneri str. 2008720114]|uniref:AbiJ-NTD4 domain-containing protein n=1 Tax=Leptospira kirschneri TaxID=29507 RepID=UPI000297FA0C|nr:hypothetical protein [Leptospira kirschneri]EKP05452.1 hypothetical protein LEP1GSC018_1504 [Leptospira kirschneri str. 2008720114]